MCGILRGYPTTSISGNNILKCLLECDFLASCSGIPPLELLYLRQVTHYLCQHARKSLYSKHF